MQPVFNLPVHTTQLQEPFGTCFLSCQAGDSIHHFMADFAIFDPPKVSLQFENLLGIGPIQILSQLTADSDRPSLDAPMPFLHRPSGVKVFHGWTEALHALFGLEEGLNVLAQLRLVVLDGPDIITPSLDNLDR